jgi:hypothetical protein
LNVATTSQRPRYPDDVNSMTDMALLEFLRRPITVEEYNRMAETGILDPDERIDSVKKLKIYADAGVPEYWIADVRRSALIVHRDPNSGVYDSVQTFRCGSNVSFAAFPDETFSVDELIG